MQTNSSIFAKIAYFTREFDRLSCLLVSLCFLLVSLRVLLVNLCCLLVSFAVYSRIRAVYS
ncbi:hypothetical protein ACDZ29_05000 [Peribacillus sp. RS7]|uniref:hypothetical protein n=1 Tax=Peribacillus sp. RS7 TaxID=3242679 RepID=UPI0035BF9484